MEAPELWLCAGWDGTQSALAMDAHNNKEGAAIFYGLSGESIRDRVGCSTRTENPIHSIYGWSGHYSARIIGTRHELQR